MEPFALLCSQFFSAAHSSSHFKDFQHFYFHNCIYDNLYRDIERRDGVSTEHLLRTLGSEYRVMLVGDASMAAHELTQRNGAIYYYEHNDTPGIVRLKKMADHFSHSVWLNPDPPYYWNHPTVSMIGRIFPMFEFTLEGLRRALKKLVVKK